MVYVPTIPIINNQPPKHRPLKLTSIDIHRPHIRPHELRLARVEGQREPDVAAAAEQAGTPAVAGVEDVVAEGKLEGVLRVVRARVRRCDVGLGGEGAVD